MQRALLSVALLALTACGGASVPTTTTPPAVTAPRAVEGVVRYGARAPTPRGASAAETLRPSRQILVRAYDAAGGVTGETRTDEEGRFRFEVPGETIRIELVSQVRDDALDLATTTDPRGLRPHVFPVSLPAPTGEAAPLTIDIGDEHDFAGALHIVDTLLLGARTVRSWTGESVPPFYAYWGRGLTTDWSYYRGEVVAGSGRYSIELLGGDPGRQNQTDTDEHDEVIILHEFGHFVMDVLTSDSSHGGSHPGGALIDPGLAWEEGRASWFACAVVGRPLYLDTIGVEPFGELRVGQNIERQEGASGPRGIGSEAGVEEILWDLADGGSGEGALPDEDGDPVALGAPAILNAMRALGREPGAYPGISSFLRYLVRSGAAPHLQVKNLLLAGGHPDSMLPVDDTPLWPLDLPLGMTVGGKIDSLSNPAPSGGPPRVGNGRDAVHVYRVHMEQPGRLDVHLVIHGSGQTREGQDVDIELRDIRSDMLDRSAGVGPTETISYLVDAGWYVIYVRDGGAPTRVSYELTARRGR